MHACVNQKYLNITLITLVALLECVCCDDSFSLVISGYTRRALDKGIISLREVTEKGEKLVFPLVAHSVLDSVIRETTRLML